MKLLWDAGTKVCSNGPGHMAAMPIYGKNLKSLLLNQKADYLKTWYVASGAIGTASVNQSGLGCM